MRTVRWKEGISSPLYAVSLRLFACLCMHEVKVTGCDVMCCTVLFWGLRAGVR